MIDVDAVERLARADAGAGPDVLAERLDRTLHRRGRLRASLGGVMTALVVLAGVEATSLLRPAAPGAFLRPTVEPPSGVVNCAEPGSVRARRVLAGAFVAAALAACTDGATTGDVTSELEEGAVLQVAGDPELAGRHEYPQISEAGLFEIGRELGAEAPPEGSLVLTLEFLDDGFDWVRISGSIEPDGSARLFPSFRIDGRRFEGPACDLELRATPPGPAVGSFTCTVDDGIEVDGEFVVGDVQLPDYGG